MRFLANGDARAAVTLVLAHGAGAGMETPFMTAVAEGVAGLGHRVLRFEFPYMAARREGGAKRPPNPEAVLLACWREAIAEAAPARLLVIGGKSMGGRMASLIADEQNAAGLVCLGYPFHPPSRPEKTRTAHLAALATPTLILQGERDPFGSRAEVSGYALSSAIKVVWLADSDHDLAPRKSSGATRDDNFRLAVEAIGAFLRGLERGTS